MLYFKGTEITWKKTIEEVIQGYPEPIGSMIGMSHQGLRKPFGYAGKQHPPMNSKGAPVAVGGMPFPGNNRNEYIPRTPQTVQSTSSSQESGIFFSHRTYGKWE